MAINDDAESLINDIKDLIDELETLGDENGIDAGKHLAALRNSIKDLENDYELEEESEESESDADDD